MPRPTGPSTSGSSPASAIAPWPGAAHDRRTLPGAATAAGRAEPPSYEEIGAALGMPIGAIGPTRARCLDKLRRSPELTGIELR